MADRVELQRRLEKSDRQVYYLVHADLVVGAVVLLDIVSTIGGISYSASWRLDCS